MSEIKLNFLDDQTEYPRTFKSSDLIKDVLLSFLKSINAYESLDINIYVFQFGQKVLNSKKNINKTIDELGLSTDSEIRLTRKEDRNYARFIFI